MAKSFEGMKALIGGTLPAPNASYIVQGGKIVNVRSSLQEHIGKSLHVGGSPATDGVYTTEAGYVKTYRPSESGAGPGSEVAQQVLAMLRSHLNSAPPATLTGQKVLIGGQPAPDGSYLIKGGVVVSSSEVEPRSELAREWDRSFKAGEHLAMRRENPEKYKKLFFAKYGKEANI